jgi:hypothetical protein
MNRSFSGSLILGFIVVAIGLLLLLRNVLHIHIPVFTILASLGLIWMGVMLIRGSFHPESDGDSIRFGDGKMNYSPEKGNYSVLFGSGTLNLQDVKPASSVVLDVECTFGEMKLIINREVPLKITGNATFGNLNGPDLRSASFGPYQYVSPGYNPSLPGFTIQARVNFGELRVFYL